MIKVKVWTGPDPLGSTYHARLLWHGHLPTIPRVGEIVFPSGDGKGYTVERVCHYLPDINGDGRIDLYTV